MDRFERPERPRRMPPASAHGRRATLKSPPARSWPQLAVIALLLSTVAVLLFNQQHSGDPFKVRRELRKF